MLQEIFNVLDLPGSSARDVLAGENPFDQWASPLSGRHRVTGAELVSRYTGANPNSLGTTIAGIGAEVLVDPMNLLGGVGMLNKALKARRVNAGIQAANSLESGRYGFKAADVVQDAASSPIMRAPPGAEASLQAAEGVGRGPGFPLIADEYDPSWGDTAYEEAMGITGRAAEAEDTWSPIAGLLPYEPNKPAFRSQLNEFVDSGLPPRIQPTEFHPLARKAGVKAEELKDFMRKDDYGFQSTGGIPYNEEYLASLADEGGKSIDSSLLRYTAFDSQGNFEAGNFDVGRTGGEAAVEASRAAREAFLAYQSALVGSEKASRLATRHLTGRNVTQHGEINTFRRSMLGPVYKTIQDSEGPIFSEDQVKRGLIELFSPGQVHPNQWMDDGVFEQVAVRMKEAPGSPLSHLTEDLFDDLRDARDMVRHSFSASSEAGRKSKDLRPQFSTYTVRGSLPNGEFPEVPGTYSELVIKNTGLGFNESHFTGPVGRDYVAHVRVDGVTEASSGKKILRIQEIQSDLHQTARKYGYADSPLSGSTDRVPPDLKEDLTKAYIAPISTYDADEYVIYLSAMQKAKGDANEAAKLLGWRPQKLESMRRVLDGVEGSDSAKAAAAEAIDAMKIENARTWQEFEEAGAEFTKKYGGKDKYNSTTSDDSFFRSQVSRYRDMTETKAKSFPSDSPFRESWEELGVKVALKHAVDEGYDSIGLVRGRDIAEAVGADKNALDFYHDSKLSKHLKKIADKYGSQVRLVEGNNERYVKYVLDLTPDMKRAIRKEGQYAYPGTPPLPPDKLQPMVGPQSQAFRTRAAAADSPLQRSYDPQIRDLTPMFSRRQALAAGLYNTAARQSAVTVE